MPFHSPIVVIIWVLSSIILGILGKHRKLGSFGIFLISFFFSPLVGLIVLLVSAPRAQQKA